jgi:bromodomain adjacent to zinc finger domain protein 1A
VHKIASDLKIPIKDAIIRDDPQKYLYKIQIHEENQDKADKAGGQPVRSKWSGSLMEVQCASMRYVCIWLLRLGHETMCVFI